jgi:hypothetical protein
MSFDRRSGARAAGWCALALTAAALALPSEAGAQRRRPTPRTAPIEIRGQVPTPQVVTVRPRETPEFSRQVLVPNFYDRQFWPSILPGYAIISRRTLSGQQLTDSTGLAVPAAGTTTTPPPTAAPTTTPATPPASAPAPAPAPVDSSRRPPGRAPGR